MSDLLAIVEDIDGNEALVQELARRTPRRVTVLVDSQVADDELVDALARLMHEIESRTGAIVVGIVGDADELEGWRFDRVVRAPMPLAA